MSRSTEKNKLYMHEWYRKNRLQKLAKTDEYVWAQKNGALFVK